MLRMASSFQIQNPDVEPAEISSSYLFRYLPLNNEGDIRLFTLLPANFNDDLHVLFQAVSFENDATPYEALSYVWGVERTHAISSESGTIETPANLVLALRYIRSETESLVLFADAICINNEDQNNELERGRQVSLMSRVYQKASQVLVWLGEDDQGELNSVKWLLETFRNTPDRHISLTPPHLKVDLQNSDIFRQNLKMLGSLLSRSWFSRGWITQEICLARHAVMLNGRSRMDWAELLNLYKELYRNARGLAQCIFDQDHRAAKSKLARSLRTSKFPDPSARVLDFSYILSLSNNEQTTDPKDKVYSALSLAAESIRHSIVVDYTDIVSIEQVYTEATRAIITHEKRYSVLSQVESHRRDPKLPSWPSWVPDWRVKRLAQSMFAVKYQMGCSHGLKAIDLGFTASSSSELPILAHHVGQVVAIHDLELLRSDLNSAAQQDWRRMAAAIMRFAMSVWSDNHIPYQNASSYLAILRTLSADTLPFSDRISKGMRNRYFPLHQDILLNGVEFTEATSGVLALYYATMLETSQQHKNTATCPFDKQPKVAPFAQIDDVFLSNAMKEIKTQISIQTLHRSLFIAANGRIGLACASTTVGDEIYCFQGAAIPFLLRPTAKVSTFTLVAECYLDGIMRGELYTVEGEGDVKRLVSTDGGTFDRIFLK
ncbi:uncharacterized protein PAC_02730 [Phialocephala subalpina]|uniref:Heterokaryon incompatibility domain-containing protein n=1 Tax=Phialocephala subalpina TaxID=576137 RepID=A0A1L7WJ92_9HELO|nr:uncharacterized protein PAC_02730 [Phialocephala subalpina]